MKCKICKSKSNNIFKTIVLNRYDVRYYKCPICEFIQTEKPYWLNEAYKYPLVDLDVGLVSRNINMSKEIYKIITQSLTYQNKFLDFAGGNGMFVRIMRDMGLNLYYYDKYPSNIFAKNFEIKKLNSKNKYEAIVALEVFEHFVNPMQEISKLFKHTNTIILSTEIIPKKLLKNVDEWWYFIPEVGQHIAFYSQNTFRNIANSLKIRYITNNSNIHILTKIKSLKNPFLKEDDVIQLPSLLQQDFELVRKKISNLVIQ